MRSSSEVSLASAAMPSADGITRYILPYLVGLAAPLLVALTWSPSTTWTPLQLVIRSWSLPVAFAELSVIGIAIAEGLFRAVPRWNWPRPVAIALVALLLIASTTALTAAAKDPAVPMTIYWIVHALFALSTVYMCGRLLEPVDLVRGFLVGFAVFAAEFFLFLHAIPDWANFNWKNGFMAFAHIRHVGYYVGAMAALGFGAMAVARSRRERLWAWASASLAFGMVLWTGSRGAAVAVVGALVIGAAVAPPMRKLAAWGGALAGMAAALAVVLVAPAAPYYLMGLTHAVQQTTGRDVTTGRTHIWLNAIHAIEKHPLLGYGDGQMHAVAPITDLIQPHDIILQIALAWGLVGLVCVALIAVAYAVRAVPTVRRQGGALVPAFMAMTAIGILSLYDGALFYPLPQSIFAACAAVIASRWNGSAEFDEDGGVVDAHMT